MASSVSSDTFVRVRGPLNEVTWKVHYDAAHMNPEEVKAAVATWCVDQTNDQTYETFPLVCLRILLAPHEAKDGDEKKEGSGVVEPWNTLILAKKWHDLFFPMTGPSAFRFVPLTQPGDVHHNCLFAAVRTSFDEKTQNWSVDGSQKEPPVMAFADARTGEALTKRTQLFRICHRWSTFAQKEKDRLAKTHASAATMHKESGVAAGKIGDLVFASNTVMHGYISTMLKGQFEQIDQFRKFLDGAAAGAMGVNAPALRETLTSKWKQHFGDSSAFSVSADNEEEEEAAAYVPPKNVLQRLQDKARHLLLVKSTQTGRAEDAVRFAERNAHLALLLVLHLVADLKKAEAEKERALEVLAAAREKKRHLGNAEKEKEPDAKRPRID